MAHNSAIIDLAKVRPEQFRARRSPSIERLRAASYLCVEGSGSPSQAAFAEAIRVLYGVAYALKSARKGAGQPTFKVAPLEGLWWLGRSRTTLPAFDVFHRTDPNAWRWRLQVMVPKGVTPAAVTRTAAALATDKGDVAYRKVSLQRLDEGRVVQVLHIGPYDHERPSLLRLHDFAARQGVRLRGPHHEIYLNNPQRTAPQKLRTILRYPVR